MGSSAGLFAFALLAIALLLRRAHGEPINILYLAEEGTTVPERVLDSTIEYFKGHTDEAEVGEVHRVYVNISMSSFAMVEDLCVKVDSTIKSEFPPHIVLDMTMTGLASQAAKGITKAVAMPTVTGSYGELSEWKSLSIRAEEYLVQVNPPGDFIPEAMRSIISENNLTNVGVIYDDTIRMSYRTHNLFRKITGRYILWKTDSELDMIEDVQKTLHDLRKDDYRNFFVVGKKETIEKVLMAAVQNKLMHRSMYRWFVVSKEQFEIRCDCDEASIIQLYPDMDGALKGSSPDLVQYGLAYSPQVDNAFYFELMVQTLRTVKQLMQEVKWPANKYTTTETYNESHRPQEPDVQLRWRLNMNSEKPLVTQLKMDTNGLSWMEFSMKLTRQDYDGGTVILRDIGTWQVPGILNLSNALDKVEEVQDKKYKVAVVLQPPFVMKWRKGYYGYCIDMMDAIKKVTPGFNYEITQEEERFGFKNNKTKEWNGMVRALLNLEAEIALGSMSVMSEREQVIDFTEPFYGLVGISIMMKRIPPLTNHFYYIGMFKPHVWYMILAAYFIASFMLWIYDRWCPYSYQNNRNQVHEDEDARLFNLKECFWFCIISLTPQGGGDAPKATPGTIMANTWWVFSFVIMAAFSANLAATLTLSRMADPLENLEDLNNQFTIQFAPVKGTISQMYFERMAFIEQRFYEIWMNMTLSDSTGEYERAQMSVWTYPIGNMYSMVQQVIMDMEPQPNYEEAVKKVRSSILHGLGFALLDEGTVIDYATLTNCDLMKVGPEFSKRPFAIGVQKGSPLKAILSAGIMELKKTGVLDNLHYKWWTKNPNKKKCPIDHNVAVGLMFPNMGGVFLVIFIGLGLGIITLIIEFFLYKYRLGLKPGTKLKDVLRELDSQITRERRM